MVSGPITSWEIDEETVETVSDFNFGAPKSLQMVTAAMKLKDGILKSRDITWPTKVHLVKAMVFPVVMYGCESWTVKKAECRRIDAFELWCWKTLESPLDCKEIQPVHPKGDQSWCSLEGLMLKLKLRYFGHLMQRVDSLEKTLMLRGIGAEGEGDDRG